MDSSYATPDESPLGTRPVDRMDSRDAVIGPLPLAAPPVLGESD
ncbi:hypothetical protein [Mycobacterium sp.]|nr:hypothetical protein [Mycobacterium sp.]